MGERATDFSHEPNDVPHQPDDGEQQNEARKHGMPGDPRLGLSVASGIPLIRSEKKVAGEQRGGDENCRCTDTERLVYPMVDRRPNEHASDSEAANASDDGPIRSS